MSQKHRSKTGEEVCRQGRSEHEAAGEKNPDDASREQEYISLVEINTLAPGRGMSPAQGDCILTRIMPSTARSLIEVKFANSSFASTRDCDPENSREMSSSGVPPIIPDAERKEVRAVSLLYTLHKAGSITTVSIASNVLRRRSTPTLA